MRDDSCKEIEYYFTQFITQLNKCNKNHGFFTKRGISIESKPAPVAKKMSEKGQCKTEIKKSDLRNMIVNVSQCQNLRNYHYYLFRIECG